MECNYKGPHLVCERSSAGTDALFAKSIVAQVQAPQFCLGQGPAQSLQRSQGLRLRPPCVDGIGLDLIRL